MVFSIAAYTLFYLYIDNKEENAIAIVAEIEQYKQQNAQMNSLAAMVRDTEEGGERLASFFVDGERIIEFLETIESLADIAGVEIDVQSINETETSFDGIKNLELNIDFSGSWVRVHHFLVLIESIPIKLTSERLSLSEAQDPDAGSSWKGSLFFRTLQVIE
jgi:hypothetical protein